MDFKHFGGVFLTTCYITVCFIYLVCIVVFTTLYVALSVRVLGGFRTIDSTYAKIEIYNNIATESISHMTVGIEERAPTAPDDEPITQGRFNGDGGDGLQPTIFGGQDDPDKAFGDIADHLRDVEETGAQIIAGTLGTTSLRLVRDDEKPPVDELDKRRRRKFGHVGPDSPDDLVA